MPVWRCWHRLHLDRPYFGGGFGAPMPGRIQWSAVRDWCEYHDMSGDQFAFFDHCIRAMDGEYIEYAMEKAKAAQPTPPAAKSRLIMP